jgi:hypothetical protein
MHAAGQTADGDVPSTHHACIDHVSSCRCRRLVDVTSLREAAAANGSQCSKWRNVILIALLRVQAESRSQKAHGIDAGRRAVSSKVIATRDLFRVIRQWRCLVVVSCTIEETTAVKSVHEVQPQEWQPELARLRACKEARLGDTSAPAGVHL